MKLPGGYSDYLQPSEPAPTTKSPLEMLANACNKLESDMMLSKRDYPTSSSRSLLTATPPSPSPPSAYRLAARSSTDSGPTYMQASPRPLPSAEQPLPLLSRPGVSSPASGQPKETAHPPGVSPNTAKRPLGGGGGLKVKSAESLSPLPRSIESATTPRRPPSSQASAATSSPSPSQPTTGLQLPTFPPVSNSGGSGPGITHPYLSFGPPPPPTAGLNPYSYLGYFGTTGLAPLPPSGPCLDPLCRDPSCPTFAMRIAQAQLMAAGLPPHHTLAALGYPGYGLGLPPPPGSYPMFSGGPHPGLGLPQTNPYLQLLPPVPVSSANPATSAAATSPPSHTPGGGGGFGSSPYMCSWMQGRDFCGRRFNSSEELMAHLRSHTTAMGPTTEQPTPSAVSSSSTAAVSSSSSPPVSSALAMLQAQAQSLQRSASPASSSSSSTSSSPPSSALGGSDPRYHPYGRLLPPPPQHPLSPAFFSSLYGSPRPSLPVLP